MAGVLVFVLSGVLPVATSSAAAPEKEEGVCFVCPENRPDISIAPDAGKFLGEQRTRTGDAPSGPNENEPDVTIPGVTYQSVQVCSRTAIYCRAETPCDATELWHVVVRHVPGQEPVLVGDTCLDAATPPVPQITDAVTRHLTDSLVPTDVRVAVTPGSTVLITAPTLFRAVTSVPLAPVSKEFFAAGYPVTVTAEPTAFIWDFGDGTRLTTRGPGAAYQPGDDLRDDRFVVHRYDEAASRQVRLTVEWTGSYELAGVGTVPAGTVERVAAPITVRVAEARTELVDR